MLNALADWVADRLGFEGIEVASQQVVTQYVFKHSGENAYRESKTLLRVVALPIVVVLLRDGDRARARVGDRGCGPRARVIPAFLARESLEPHVLSAGRGGATPPNWTV